MKLNFDFTRLKEDIEDNPLTALVIGAVLLSGVTKVSKANTARRNSKTRRREIILRERLNRR